MLVFVPCNSENISCRTFLKYKKNRKQELALWNLVNRLVPENAKYCIKVHIKHVGIETKQAWSIKNYRYVCNVSPLPDVNGRARSFFASVLHRAVGDALSTKQRDVPSNSNSVKQ